MLNVNIRKISTTNSMIKNLNSKLFSTKLRNIATRDLEMANSNFSTFLRVANNNPGNAEMINRFTKEIPREIGNLDYLDVRKAISIVLKNESLHQNEAVMSVLKSRFEEIKMEKGIGCGEEGQIDRLKIGGDLSVQPMSVRFWLWFANYREKMYAGIRGRGLNLK